MGRNDGHERDFMENHESKHVAYAKVFFYTAYYNKAVAFEKQGKIKEAVDNFENALTCNRGCHATCYQLGTL